MFAHAARIGLVATTLALFASTQVACATDTSEEDPTEVAESTDPIVGGTISAPGAWPGAVALYKGSFVCGGSLIAPQWVLTAAHCVTTSSTTGGFTKVVIGKSKLSGTGGESITPDKAFRHESYSSSGQDNDLALIHLSTPSSAPVTKLVSSAQVAQLVNGVATTVVGWGTTSEGGSVSDALREVTVPVIDNTKCKTFSGYSRVTNNMICAATSTGGKDSCQGDSGGPLFQNIGGKNIQVGIVSWGIGCARANAPGVYTRVGNYLPWIKAKTGVDANAITTPPSTSSSTGG